MYYLICPTSSSVIVDSIIPILWMRKLYTALQETQVSLSFFLKDSFEREREWGEGRGRESSSRFSAKHRAQCEAQRGPSSHDP